MECYINEKLNSKYIIAKRTLATNCLIGSILVKGFKMHDQANMKSPEILQLPYERNLIHVFLNLTIVLKIYDLIHNELWKLGRNFSKLSTIKNKSFG